MQEQKTNISAVNRVNKVSKIATLKGQKKEEFLQHVEYMLSETVSLFKDAYNPTPTLLLDLLNSDLATIKEVYIDLINQKVEGHE
ncbi:MAG: hypothetical protein QXT77_08210 [Candidatus Methanomethylicaceae archaeon]